MIDHISIGVADLEKSSAFCERVLGAIEPTKLIEKPGTIGFGKQLSCILAQSSSTKK